MAKKKAAKKRRVRSRGAPSVNRQGSGTLKPVDAVRESRKKAARLYSHGDLVVFKGKTWKVQGVVQELTLVNDTGATMRATSVQVQPAP